MKNLFCTIFLCISVPLFAQNISGLYSGTLYNDSAKQTQQYELALSEYRGKITGFAYATFIKNDTFYYSIRRVHATRDAGQLVVEDQEMLVNNFPVKPDKGVRRTSVIPLQNLKEADTLATFTGNWKTNLVKNKFHSVPGTMDMKRATDSTQSALIAHLRELNIIAPENKMVVNNPTPVQKTVAVAREEKEPKIAAATKTVTKNKHEDLKKLKKPATKPATGAEIATLSYMQRSKTKPQTFEVGSDSLVLSFYDNGVVDGDVISVYINGETFIANAKLLESATKKTIHINTNSDSVELLLVAETLGSIPPNTGLLVVQDGSARYEVRFSADLQTNAAIVFRKRK